LIALIGVFLLFLDSSYLTIAVLINIFSFDFPFDLALAGVLDYILLVLGLASF